MEEDLVTGISLVDEQHQELLKRTNEFLDHMKTGDEIEDLIKLMDYLTLYVYDHFISEESVMAENNYPGYITHKQEHTRFINVVADLEKRMPNEINLTSFKTEVQEKMRDWLSNHILIQDKEMAKYIKTNQRHQMNGIVNPSSSTKI